MRRTPSTPLLAQCLDAQGVIDPRALADVFHTHVEAVAALTGRTPRDLLDASRSRTEVVQGPLSDLVTIIDRLTPWCGHPVRAYAWYCSEPLPSFGNRTAEMLVKGGQFTAVLRYLDRIADGGYT